MDRAAFVETFGSIYEHSPWIAERAWGGELGPANDTAVGLAFALRSVFRAATEAEQLAVLRAHPDLAGRLAAPDVGNPDLAKGVGDRRRRCIARCGIGVGAAVVGGCGPAG